MKINYKLQEGLELQRNGSMIDLMAAEDIKLTLDESTHTKLNFSLELPKYIGAKAYGRSSLFKNYGIMLANNVGIIDPPLSNKIKGIKLGKSAEKGYIGNGDIWRATFISISKDALKTPLTILKGERVIQFELYPIMDAPWYAWLKWIFKKGIHFNRVTLFKTISNRGGHGSSGK